ncbi:MAG: hypothetical protein IJR01_05475 [Bacteroidales bacterium]|nr:hypothetical protein [Bacteroidales bacterium]
MKKLWVLLAALTVAAGLVIASCGGGSDKNDDVLVDFETFHAELLDFNLWKNINEPGVMGLYEIVPLAIGRSDYKNAKLYPGKVLWGMYPEGVVVFVETSKSTVSHEGTSAEGNIIGIKAIAEGTVEITALDNNGHNIKHTFLVGEGQHYSPDGQWDENINPDYPSGWYPNKSSSSGYDGGGNSGSSSSYNGGGNSGSSSGYNKSSSSNNKSSSSHNGGGNNSSSGSY